jgi:arylsulfatase A-like enzyme/Tfp pilus assembly protein PilF
VDFTHRLRRRRSGGSLARHSRWIAALAAVLSLLGACRGRSPSAPPNLLLVTIDTVRADHLGAYGYKEAETPNLDRLARSGVRFDQAISAVPLTLPSHATILSGLLPPHHGLRKNGSGRFPASRETLATHFSAAGYRTGAFVGAYILDRRFGLARGFDTYDDEIARDPSAPGPLEAERPGREVVDRALGWLAKDDRSRPFFAWVHLYDAHAPYDPPEPYRSRHRDRPYDGEIASVDAQVGRLLDWLTRAGREKNTLIAIAADHGESLGEHGELTHGFFIYEPTLRVPLILRGPHLAPGRVVATPVSLDDLAPTLAGLAQYPLTGATDGRDLSRDLLRGGEPAVADLYSETEYPRNFGWSGLSAIRRKSLKYIESPRPELFDLTRDPKETRSLADARAPRTDLAAAIAAFRRETAAPETPDAADRESAAKLASLGYVSGSTSAPEHSGLRDPKDVLGAFRRFEDAHWDLVGGRVEPARQKLLEALASDPDNPVFLDSLGLAYRRLGDFAAAIRSYRRAVELSPGDAYTRYDLAVTLKEAGRIDEAFIAAQDALSHDASRPDALDILGITLLAKGKPEQALEQFDRAAALDPRDARIENNRGNVLRELKRPAEAEAAYRRSIALAPSYADPWNGLGALEVEQRRFVEAVASFGRAIALAPEDHEARLNRGIALEMAGDLPSAVSAYRDFLVSSDGDPRFARQRQVASQLIARLARKESENSQPERR